MNIIIIYPIGGLEKLFGEGSCSKIEQKQKDPIRILRLWRNTEISSVETWLFSQKIHSEL